MLTYPNIDPVALSIGPFNIYWYGIMYIVAFGIAFMLARFRAKQFGSGFSVQQADDLVTWAMLGVVIGARVGYVLFYDFNAFQNDYLEIFKVWNGGMSFHGGLLGLVFAVWWWSLRNKKNLLSVLDFVAPLAPLGLMAGRIGNFINAELWGKVTTVPWAMVFPYAGNSPRHPSQIYEALLEGLILFIIIWVYSRKVRVRGSIAGLFAVLYAIFRMFAELFREPDSHIGYLYNYFTMGQLLSMPMLLAGIILLIFAYNEKKHPTLERVVLKDGEVVFIKSKL